MDLFDIIGEIEEVSPLQKRYKKNLPKVKKIVRALVYDLPIVVVTEEEKTVIADIIQAEECLIQVLDLFEREGKIKIKIYKRYI